AGDDAGVGVELEAGRERADAKRPTCMADAAGRSEREAIALTDLRASDAERPDLQFRRDGQRYPHLGAPTIRVGNGEHDWEGARLRRNSSQVAGRAVALVADEAGVLGKRARDLPAVAGSAALRVDRDLQRSLDLPGLVGRRARCQLVDDDETELFRRRVAAAVHAHGERAA